MSDRIEFPRHQEDAVSASGRQRRGDRLVRRLKTLPVLPTILTAGNLAAGVSALMAAATGRIELGAILIFAAMVCDMLDGKVARLTRTEGAFGAELDSLADIVSFGVAPAMLVHRLVLDKPGIFMPSERLIWIVTIFYCVMAAIRLAKYNIEHADGRATRHFSGLPSPGAAALLCSWIIFHAEVIEPAEFGPLINQLFRQGMTGMTALCGIVMVSNLPFPHLGNTLLGDRLSFRRLILVLLTIFVVVYQPVYGLVLATSGYLIYGLVIGIRSSLRSWRAGRSIFDDDDDDAEDLDDGQVIGRA